MNAASYPGAWRPYLSVQFVLLVIVLATATWAVVPFAPLMAFMAETGPIERGTAALYFLSALLLWGVPAPGLDLPRRLALSLAMLAFGARELDLHKAWTGMSVLKVSFYLHDAPLKQKLVALAVLLPVAAAFGYLVLAHLRLVIDGLRRRHPVAITVAVFFGTIVLSKLIDRSENVLLEDYGFQFPEWLSALRASLEETLELCLPLLLWIGLLQQRRTQPPLLKGR